MCYFREVEQTGWPWYMTWYPWCSSQVLKGWRPLPQGVFLKTFWFGPHLRVGGKKCWGSWARERLTPLVLAFASQQPRQPLTKVVSFTPGKYERFRRGEKKKQPPGHDCGDWLASCGRDTNAASTLQSREHFASRSCVPSLFRSPPRSPPRVVQPHTIIVKITTKKLQIYVAVTHQCPPRRQARQRQWGSGGWSHEKTPKAVKLQFIKRITEEGKQYLLWYISIWK